MISNEEPVRIFILENINLDISTSPVFQPSNHQNPNIFNRGANIGNSYPEFCLPVIPDRFVALLARYPAVQPYPPTGKHQYQYLFQYTRWEDER